jgi:glyoxylase-like metal-dependent hydrolase (beta-lactamase superfamily II)
MRIHAIQTGTVAIKQRQVRGSGQGLGRRLNTMLDRVWTDPLPIYVWVIEHPEGIIVVDTGETARASQAGYFPWWHPYYRLGVREWVRPEEEVGPQLRALGIPPEKVRWVIMTHLHSDHAGGLRTNLFDLRRCAVVRHLHVPFSFPVASGCVSRRCLMVLTNPSYIGEPIEIVFLQERHEHQ